MNFLNFLYCIFFFLKANLIENLIFEHSKFRTSVTEKANQKKGELNPFP